MSRTCVICQSGDPYRPDLSCICQSCRGYLYDSLVHGDNLPELSLLRLFGGAITLRKEVERKATAARDSIQQLDLAAETQ